MSRRSTSVSEKNRTRSSMARPHGEGGDYVTSLQTSLKQTFEIKLYARKLRSAGESDPMRAVAASTGECARALDSAIPSAAASPAATAGDGAWGGDCLDRRRAKKLPVPAATPGRGVAERVPCRERPAISCPGLHVSLLPSVLPTIGGRSLLNGVKPTFALGCRNLRDPGIVGDPFLPSSGLNATVRCSRSRDVRPGRAVVAPLGEHGAALRREFGAASRAAE